MSDGQVHGSSKIRMEQIHPRIRNLADALAKVHGDVTVTSESKGIHLNMASPIALEKDGDIELAKKHLAVNASRYLCQGRYVNMRHSGNNDMAAYCMKYRKPYSVRELLLMDPIEVRCPQYGGKEHKVYYANRERRLVSDGKGNMIPPGPGHVIPILDLPEDHPAVWYLKTYRKYDLHRLTDQFRVGYCDQELDRPTREALDIYYRPLPLGFASTPQGRIIFFADVHGVQVGWQGRVIDYSDQGKQFYWHPYQDRWIHCEDFNPTTGKWEPIDEIRDSKLEWKKLPKYKTADYMARAEVVFGFDAAVRWNEGKVVETAVLCEGPLDAGRAGPPAVGMVGASLSELQAALLTSRFRNIWFVRDQDRAGISSLKSVEAHLGAHGLRMLDLPANSNKDLGDLDPTWVNTFMAPVYLGAAGFVL